ncbi:MAG: (2Fe-2S)-binding protein [Pirellulales bacterium]|jgi:ferredoxin|nr:ferredoxin [Rhodopirellula sp.]MCH2371191.1 (2Fe-2S)-binding protein [Pirellulales bacterium]|tara:strand:+ start:4119 stop:4511 length:393 start_codon:yes stop_codon:yes gene_type:complete
MPKVKFSKENQEVSVPEGTTIRDAAKLLSINTNQGINGIGATLNKYINCHGLGQCGTCRVFVTEGHGENTNTQTIWEKKCFNLPFPDPLPALAYLDNPEETRLACQCKVTGDVTVETGPEVNLFGENFFS